MTPQEIADLIRAEMVCCDIYQRMESVWKSPGTRGTPQEREQWRALKKSHEYHDICYFGEWAAQLAERGK